MARKLASAVALVLMVLSATVLALGLGDITTRSALNQGFDADVELLSVDPADLDTLKVSLASAEAFQRAGVDRPFFLSDLKFTPMLGQGGKPVIHIHSDQPIREPFLNFLIEVNWPKGKLVREYTVLLDPPTTLKRRPSPVARPQAETRTVAPAAPAVARPMPVMPDQYGPVQDSETLWGIASKLRPDGASLAQTLMALYKANPDAFIHGDINRLERGRILRVPGHDEVFALSRHEAQAAYRAEQDAALAARSQPPAKATQPAGTGTAATTPSEDAELRIATPRPAGKGEAGAGDDTAAKATTDDLKNALLLAREDAESSRQAADNLRGQVDSMQQQLADMQRLLSLKDEQLARLQANVEETGTVAGTAETPAAAEGAAPAAAEQPPAEPAVQTPAETPVTEEAAAPAAPSAEPPAVSEPEPQPMPQREQGLLDLLAGNPLLVGGGAAAVILLLVLLLLLRRRGKAAQPEDEGEAEETLEESILLEPTEGEDYDLNVDDAAPAGNDTSFLSEFSASEMHSLADDTSEVDPVSEADVYIAYGRYDQAEELLDQALNREPQRLALKFKLLEVYYANHNVPAFTACAQELADAGQDGVDAEAWQRVCDMGRELAPDYPLFSKATSQTFEESLPDFEPSQPASIDTLSEFNEESILEIPQAETNQEGSSKTVDAVSEHVPETEMDLTLDLEDLSLPQSVAHEDDSLEGLESIELELPDLDVDPGKKATASDVSDDSLILELDTGLEDSMIEPGRQPAADELDAESLQAQLDELSDLTDLDDELSQLTAEFDGMVKPSTAEAVEELPSEDLSELEIPTPFAGQMAEEDEVQTKLDLAIAYVEMGDKEGARSILDEVCVEGSDAQKAKAEKLLADISA